MPKYKDISILDVTIRDGSYAINYQYTPAQVANIASALDQAGIHYIESSHGCGIGAAKNLGFPAAATDVEYVRAAKIAVKRAKVGVIAGPSPVTRKEDIDQIIEEVDFIRFAANCDDPQRVEENLTYALKKRPKLHVFFQLMRCGRIQVKDIVRSALIAEKMGASIIYVVDTAGHFLPQETAKTISAIKSRLVRAHVGFHGHNNLGLAIANTLAAIDAGATFVDASLKGIGRSGGNAQLEALVSLLKRGGRARPIDLDVLLEAGEKFIAPIMPPQGGISATDLLTGDANIDLYPVELYEDVAKKAKIPFRKLVRALGRDRKLIEAGLDEISRALTKLGNEEKK